jgi:hypothetical protein
MGLKSARAQHAHTTKPKRDFPNRLLDRYQIVFVLAVLLAASTLAWATMAIFIPVPPSHIIIARNLRLLDAKIRSGISTRDLTVLQTEVSDIEQAASVLPMRHSDLFFQLRTQIELTRGRLARAAAEPTPAPGGSSRVHALVE